MQKIPNSKYSSIKTHASDTLFQTNTVVRTDHTLQQYLELGNQSQACITIPESCGTQGGTISVWVKPLGCPDGGGIISSQDTSQSAVIIACSPTELRYMTIPNVI